MSLAENNLINIWARKINFSPDGDNPTIEVDQGGGITNWDTDPPTTATPDDAAHSNNTVWTPDPEVGHNGPDWSKH